MFTDWQHAADARARLLHPAALFFERAPCCSLGACRRPTSRRSRTPFEEGGAEFGPVRCCICGRTTCRSCDCGGYCGSSPSRHPGRCSCVISSYLSQKNYVISSTLYTQQTHCTRQAWLRTSSTMVPPHMASNSSIQEAGSQTRRCKCLTFRTSSVLPAWNWFYAVASRVRNLLFHLKIKYQKSLKRIICIHT